MSPTVRGRHVSVSVPHLPAPLDNAGSLTEQPRLREPWLRDCPMGQSLEHGQGSHV
jgi:hypothetical protein